MQYLKQSTAVTLKLGPFLDDTDGKTAETALTIAQVDVRLSKNGGDIAQKTAATSCTHDELGIYGCPVDVTDTNTLGRLQLFIHESGALPVWHEFMVIPANVYDSMFSTDKLEVDLLQIGGVAQSATDLKDFADAGYDPSSNKIEGCKVNDDMVGTASAALASVCTEARLGHLDADITTRSSHSAANVWSAGSRELSTPNNYKADVSALALEATLSDIKGTGFVKDTHSLPQCLTAAGFSTHTATDIWSVGTRAITDKVGFALSSAGVTAIWNKNISAYVGAGYAGTYIKTIFDDWLNAGRLDLILDVIAADVTGLNGDAMRGTDGANTTTPPTVNAIADQVWDELLTGASHNIATSAGRRLRDLSALSIHSGTAQAGTATTITLRDYASAINDTYLCNILSIIAGTGCGQARLVGSYNGSTKVATICGDDWVTTPDNTSVYVMVPYGTTCASCIGTYALSQINAECDTALTDYDPPTRTEATADKDAIITEVDANETKIDTIDTVVDAIKAKTDNLPSGIQKVEITSGYYKIDLTQSEMNADVIGFKATATGANQTSLVVVTS
jgi:hypothetical protein